jgi:carbon storage regulator
MLVLTRRLNQSVVLPSIGLVITVVAVQGNVVRLGFATPPGVTVHREEIWRRLAGPAGAEREEGPRCAGS